jgi:hypothetical protein
VTEMGGNWEPKAGREKRKERIVDIKRGRICFCFDDETRAKERKRLGRACYIILQAGDAGGYWEGIKGRGQGVDSEETGINHRI